MGQQEFIQIFGNVSLSDIVVYVLAIEWIYTGAKRLYNYFKSQYKETELKDEALTNAIRLPDFKEESIKREHRIEERFDKIEKDNNKRFDKIEKTLDTIQKRLDESDERQRQKDLSDTQTSLLQAFQYYTNSARNPMKSWTSLEKKSFMDTFEVYKSKGGDGYMDEKVAPVMATLIEISMNDDEAVSELMKSRNQIYEKQH